MSGPILRHFDPAKACAIEADASDSALGAVCSQYDDEGRLHPVAFYSRKLLPAEMNYQIYDKELLAIVCAFKHSRHYLEFSADITVVLTDHRNLEYFTTTRNLSRRQVRWSEVLSDYNFVIKYRSGSQNAAADSLSRRDKPEGGSAAALGKTALTFLLSRTKQGRSRNKKEYSFIADWRTNRGKDGGCYIANVGVGLKPDPEIRTRRFQVRRFQMRRFQKRDMFWKRNRRCLTKRLWVRDNPPPKERSPGATKWGLVSSDILCGRRIVSVDYG